ncbi:hypothetical protein AOLI_G00139130 [Acnodon oligacanthus]
MAKFLCLGQLCLILTLCSVSSAFSCRWNYRKFRQYHGNCLTLLREMDTGTSGDSEKGNIFDADWFIHHTHSQPVKQVWLVIQTLEEISALLTEADPVPWNKEQLHNFLSMLDYEMEELRLCVPVRVRTNKRLSLYFKQLRGLIHNNTGDQINVWEQIRKELLDLLNLLESFPADYLANKPY